MAKKKKATPAPVPEVAPLEVTPVEATNDWGFLSEIEMVVPKAEPVVEKDEIKAEAPKEDDVPPGFRRIFKGCLVRLD